MQVYGADFWKRTPFLRLLLAFMAGIILQWNYSLPLIILLLVGLLCLAGLLGFFFMPVTAKFRYSLVAGVLSSLAFGAAGGIVTYKKDVRNNPDFLGHHYHPGDYLVAVLDENPVEKTKSFKANARISRLISGDSAIPVQGHIIIYFKKDSSLKLSYGTQLLFKKDLQAIKNSGNPGGFDYKRFSLFQGITHQVYLKPGEYETLPGQQQHWFRQFLYNTRNKILDILRQYINGDKELGLAEALLIGYKNDLEQSLVQSYTNTGVVHIIAISGLHLGLIYWLLTILMKPLEKRKRIKWLRPVLIIGGLWLFSLLAGAQPSILRSAVMFTCIVLGDSLSRKTSIYNTMAFSAFLLLCINPFWLWDVGFQLSYAAVLSIIIFMKPVYNWFYIPNKALDFIWKLNAVTIAAQVLTVPIGIYHFHQFPNLFLLTNFLAVPLSSIILLGEIALCSVAFIPAVATQLGRLLSWLINSMNLYIEKIESIRYSLWDGLQITILQATLLLLFTAGISYWLLEKSKQALLAGCTALFVFASLRTFSFIERDRQQKIIVYNVPQKRAVDFVNGRHYYFIGDSDLLADDFARNFHLKPSRILFRISPAEQLDGLTAYENFARYRGKNIMLLDRATYFSSGNEKPVVDLLVISKNPKLYMKKLAAGLEIKQVVFDGSVPSWKTRYWKKDCDSLQIPWHDVTTNGAFVMNLN
ncbi:MAG TPA: ComEC/Rec2 family competence protein [Chitinophagaceae bacterium]|nr:ComEC/Rec2 family competence protein [Chitinophagaceae bacterium]